MTRRYSHSHSRQQRLIPLASICEDKIWKPSRFGKAALPKLEKRDAIQVPKISHEKTPSTYVPDYSILDSYKSHPYLQYNSTVSAGFMSKRETGLDSDIPTVITDLCYQYCHSEQDGIFQLAYVMSKLTKSASIKPVSAIANNDPKMVIISFGFTGIELIQKMRKCIHGFSHLCKTDILYYCNLLIRYKYIKPVNSTLLFGGCYDTVLGNVNNKYEFNQRKINVFAQYTKFKQFSDRLAWNIGTIVEINSSQCNGWRKGQIVDIVKKQKVTIVFTTKSGQILRKSVNRFDANKVRSTQRFVQNRLNWTENAEIEVYSHTKHQWQRCIIDSVTVPNASKPFMDHLHIRYSGEGESETKSIARWSSDIRDISDSDATFFNRNGVKSGSKCNVWSKSAAKWIVGHVKVCIPIVKCVLVKYANSEKIIQIGSDQLQILF